MNKQQSHRQTLQNNPVWMLSVRPFTTNALQLFVLVYLQTRLESGVRCRLVGDCRLRCCSPAKWESRAESHTSDQVSIHRVHTHSDKQTDREQTERQTGCTHICRGRKNGDASQLATKCLCKRNSKRFFLKRFRITHSSLHLSRQ